MRLYHCADARSFRVLWALEELALEYELVLLPFPPRVRAREYLAVNPLGTIPFFEDDQTRMTESAAIVEYLAARHGRNTLAVAPEDPAFGAWLNWLHFGEATLTFPQTLVLRYTRLEPEARRLPQAAADYAKWFAARLRALEGPLEQDQWICAGRFTGADISVGYALLLAENLQLHDGFSPAVQDYWTRLQARAAFQSAKSRQGGNAAGAPPF